MAQRYTPFELLFNCVEPQGHLISTIYTLLFSKHNVKEDKIVRQWESDLSLNLTPTDWKRIFTLIHKGSINVLTQENRYKLFSKWYRTPDKIHHFPPTPPPHPAGAAMQHVAPCFTYGGSALISSHFGQKSIT